jgi:ribose transport system ATP-binding protein
MNYYTNNKKNKANMTVLEMEGISKSFPGIKALNNVSLKLQQGEVLALLGENGAGKTTLIKIIAGLLHPDTNKGIIKVWGKSVYFSNSYQARCCGIGVVHQERNLVPTFTIGENILIKQITEGAMKIVNSNQLYHDALGFMNLIGLKLSPYQQLKDTTAAQKQLIDIARALSLRAKILLLDEPTASTSSKEADNLFKIMERLKKQGISFVYVTHKMEEVFQIADSVMVLKDTKNSGFKMPIEEVDSNKLIKLMIGRSKIAKNISPTKNFSKNEKILEVKNLYGKKSPKKNSFILHKGEILGWYGLIGSGRTELTKVIIGVDPKMGGEIYLKGRMIKIRSISEALYRYNIAYLTENRKEEGLFLLHPIMRNISASIWDYICKWFYFLDSVAEGKNAEYYRKKLGIQTPNINQLVNNLSGGNRQKVSIAKVLSTNPEILIIDEPTVGIDIKTKYEIHKLIAELSKKGMSIIMISSDMPEIVQVADRIIVFRNGEMCGEFQNTREYDLMSKRIAEFLV